MPGGTQRRRLRAENGRRHGGVDTCVQHEGVTDAVHRHTELSSVATRSAQQAPQRRVGGYKVQAGVEVVHHGWNSQQTETEHRSERERTTQPTKGSATHQWKGE